MWNDLITAGLQLAAFACNCVNLCALVRDKRVCGVAIMPSVFFTALGFWQVYVFGFTIGPFSSVCAFLVGAVNLAWVVLALRYRTPAAAAPIERLAM